MEARRDGYFLGLGAAEGLSLEQAAAKRAREDAKADQAMHLKRKKQESQLLSTTNARTWRWQSLGPAKAWFATGLPPTACAPLLQEQDRSFLLSRHGWFVFFFASRPFQMPRTSELHASVFVVDDSAIPSKAYFMAMATGGCILSYSLLLKRAGIKSQYCLQKLESLKRKWPTLHRTPDFKQQEPAMTHLLRWAVFEKKMWSGVALENVRKNTICLVKDKTDANLAQLKQASGHWHSKDEFVQLLTAACIDYGRSFGVSAA